MGNDVVSGRVPCGIQHTHIEARGALLSEVDPQAVRTVRSGYEPPPPAVPLRVRMTRQGRIAGLDDNLEDGISALDQSIVRIANLDLHGDGFEILPTAGLGLQQQLVRRAGVSDLEIQFEIGPAVLHARQGREIDPGLRDGRRAQTFLVDEQRHRERRPDQ